MKIVPRWLCWKQEEKLDEFIAEGLRLENEIWKQRLENVLEQGRKQVEGTNVAKKAAIIDPIFAAKLARRRAKERRELRGQI